MLRSVNNGPAAPMRNVESVGHLKPLPEKNKEALDYRTRLGWSLGGESGQAARPALRWLVFLFRFLVAFRFCDCDQVVQNTVKFSQSRSSDV